MYDQEWELQAAYEAIKDVCGEVDPWHVPLRYQTIGKAVGE